MPPSGYTIAPLDRDDAALLAEYRIRMIQTHYPADDFDWAAYARQEEAWFRRALEEGRAWAWAARDDGGRVAAVAGLSIYDITPKPWVPTGVHGYISSMYTRPEHRRRGLGRALLQTAIEAARRMGLTTLTLHASSDGRPLYEAAGFKAVNEMRLVLEPNTAAAKKTD